MKFFFKMTKRLNDIKHTFYFQTPMIIIWLINTNSTIITWTIDYRAHSGQQISTEIMNIIHCQIRPVKLFFMELSKIF